MTWSDIPTVRATVCDECGDPLDIGAEPSCCITDPAIGPLFIHRGCCSWPHGLAGAVE